MSPSHGRHRPAPGPIAPVRPSRPAGRFVRFAVPALIDPGVWFAAATARRSRLFGTPVRRRISIGSGAMVVCGLVVVLVGLLLGGTRAPNHPPAPVAAGAPQEAPTSAPPSSPDTGPRFRCSIPATHRDGGPAPVRICIPAIKVDASVTRLGLNSDHTVEVPPLSKVREAGWYRYSALPGVPGPTVVLGHVNSAEYGDGVFLRLGDLRSGDRVTMTSGNGRTATFAVGKVAEVSKQHFPTQEVYGGTSGPAMRLVTCGGSFDSATGSYRDNIIAYGTLVSRGTVRAGGA